MTGAIDVHAHYVPHGWPQLPGPEPRLWLDISSESEATMMIGSREFRRINSSAWAADVRLADMDADDVDIQVVSPTPVFFAYDSTPADAAAIARIFNDLALEITAESPRLLPFCQVPLQDTDLACAELERSVANGHLGVEIGNHVADRDLDDEGVVTFLQHCASLGVPVFVHPWDLPNSKRLDRWMAQWLTGMPAETHLSILAMVLGGAFDRLPAALRICFAHGGGSFPYWLGRMDNAWRQRHDVIGSSEHPPSLYRNRFSVDTVVFEEAPLRLLVDALGADRVMVGSDYPYPLGERPMGAVVRKATFLGDSDRQLLLRQNAATWLGIDQSAAAS